MKITFINWKQIFLPSLVFFLFTIPAVAQTVAKGLGGSWEGNVTQDNPLTTYRVEMILYGNVGSISYPTIGCSGNLQFIKTDGTVYSYREHITNGTGKCIDGGLIQIRRNALGDDAYWEWRWEGGGVKVRGVIRGSGVQVSKY